MPFVPDFIPREDREVIRREFTVQIALIGIVIAACAFRLFFLGG